MARPVHSRAYWDIATHSRRPEGANVLPPSSLPVDQGRHHSLTPLEQTPSDGIGVVECGDGVGPLMRPECGQRVLGARLGTQAQYRAPAVAGILLRGHGQAGAATPGAGGPELLCP